MILPSPWLHVNQYSERENHLLSLNSLQMYVEYTHDNVCKNCWFLSLDGVIYWVFEYLRTKFICVLVLLVIITIYNSSPIYSFKSFFTSDATRLFSPELENCSVKQRYQAEETPIGAWNIYICIFEKWTSGERMVLTCLTPGVTAKKHKHYWKGVLLSAMKIGIHTNQVFIIFYYLLGAKSEPETQRHLGRVEHPWYIYRQNSK